MTNLAQVIKFRLLADQLIPDEFNQFILRFIITDKSFLLKALFNQFIQTINQNENDITLNHSTNIISNIINSRKSKQKTIIKPSINNLCHELIGEIASYFSQNDYFSFSKSNRTIYIGCNAPNKLLHLNCSEINDYSSINFQKFRSLQHLEININKLHQLQLPSDTKIFNNLSKLSLDNKGETDANIQVIQQSINIDNLTDLKLANFGSFRGTKFNPLKFKQIVGCFSMIKYLTLYGVYITSNNIDGKEINEMLPNLQGLAISGCCNNAGRKLINSLGNRLDTVMFNGNFYINNLDSSVSFHNVKELYLWYPTANILDFICKDTKKMEKIGIRLDQSPKMNDIERSNAIKEILWTQKLLKVLRIRCFSDIFVNICNCLELALFQIKKKLNDTIKIEIAMDCDITPNLENIILNTLKMINFLQSLTKHYMVKLEFYGENKPNDIDKTLINIKQIAVNLNIYSQNNIIVFSNKQCIINGHGTWWMC